MCPTYAYPRPAVTVDVTFFAVVDRRLQLLLIRRKSPPFKNHWVLPGGFLDMDEALEAAARRELVEETGLKVGCVHELGAYGNVGRDPRGRTISVAFVAVHCGEPPAAQAGDDASDARWFPVRRLPKMAFDHRQIIRDARRWLTKTLDESSTDVLGLLPQRVSGDDLVATYAAIRGKPPERARLVRRLITDGAIVEHRNGTPPKRTRNAKRNHSSKRYRVVRRRA